MNVKVHGFSICLLIFIFLTGCKNNPTETSESKKSHSQIMHDILEQVYIDSLQKTVKELSGEIPVIINGHTHYIYSRYKNSPSNDIAADYIQNRMEKYNLAVENFYFDSLGRNVLAHQTGIEFPDQKYIICAHYDNMPESGRAPGADDNASGVAAVIEAARIISKYKCKYTIIYALWDEEEQGSIGSTHYATLMKNLEVDILGVIDIDMIAYDGDYNNCVLVNTNNIANSVELSKKPNYLNLYYNVGLKINIINPARGSDSRSFWNNGYTAIGLSEKWPDDFNDCYHTSEDKIEHFNLSYFYKCSKLAIVTLADQVY
jgi:hypothetical protein